MVTSPDQSSSRIGVEISDTVLRAVVVDASDNIVESRSVAVESPEGTVAQLSDLINQLRSSFGDPGQIGIAVPGLVDRKTGRVAYSANIPRHADIDLVTE